MARRLLAARLDLAEEVARIARSRNQTVYGFLNSVLEQVLRVYRAGLRLEDVVSSYMVLKTLKSLGFTPLPEEIAFKALNALSRSGSEVGRLSALKLGEWYGRALKVQLPKLSGFEILELVLREVAWGASETSVSRDDGLITVRCVDPRFPPSYTQLLAQLVEGMALSMGFKPVRRYITRGVVLLTFKADAGENVKT